MTYDVRLTRSAEKELARLPKATARGIARKLEKLAEEPRPTGCQKLKGFADLWRIRSGDYRVIYSIDDAVLLVLVVKVRHRSDAYE